MFWRILLGLIAIYALIYQFVLKDREDAPVEQVVAVQPSVETIATPTPSQQAAFVYGNAGYNYVCFLPNGYGKEPKFWPMILFLHGQSSTENLESLKQYGPIGYGKQQSDFPFVVIAPATDHGWSVLQLNSFLISTQSKYMIDTDRIYLTGISMGGHATWHLACAYPSHFAAIAPVCGAGEPRTARRKLTHVPAWVFHGMQDDIVPVKSGLMMIGALKGEGLEVQYTIYPDAGHNIAGQAYNNPELYEWFLQHQVYGGKKKETALSITPIIEKTGE